MAILDLRALINHFGPAAVKLSFREWSIDEKGVSATLNRHSANRLPQIRRWLEYYNVLQGFESGHRNAISAAVLTWADNQPNESSLTTLDSLIAAHASLGCGCVEAYGKARDFASLASKALWLRYPNDVPLYDRFVQRALWMVSKIEQDMPPIP